MPQINVDVLQAGQRRPMPDPATLQPAADQAAPRRLSKRLVWVAAIVVAIGIGAALLFGPWGATGQTVQTEATALKELVADLTLENRLLKKSMSGAGGDQE